MNITTLYVNSKNLATGTPTNFTYNLRPMGISNVSSFYIKQIIIPYSAYVSVYPDTSNTNSAFFAISDSSGLSNVLLTAGNYSSSTLAAALQTALNSAPGSRNTTYSVTYSDIENKFTISSTGGTFIIYWVTGQNLPGQQLYKIFGFTSANSTGASTYTSINGAQVSGTSLNYYLKSRIFTIDGSYAYFNGIKQNVLLQIPVNTNSNGIIEYINYNNDFIPLRGENINNIDLQLVDEYDNDIALNGLDWTCAIVFKS